MLPLLYPGRYRHHQGSLQQGLEGRAEARTWLLPMLRQHVSGAELGFWGRTLLPLARRMGGRAAQARAAGRQLEGLQCAALEAQLWASLPAFARWPCDAPQAFR